MSVLLPPTAFAASLPSLRLLGASGTSNTAFQDVLPSARLVDHPDEVSLRHPGHPGHALSALGASSVPLAPTACLMGPKPGPRNERDERDWDLIPEGKSLREDFVQWERMRTDLLAGGGPEKYSPNDLSHPSKILYYVDGLPGAGKSTQIQHLRAILGASHVSMAKFAGERRVSQGERKIHQLQTTTLHPADLEFLESLANRSARHLILEKFPRTPLEAAALVDFARRKGWRLHAIHLQFPRAAVAQSVRRQIDRGPRGNQPVTPHYATWRALRHLARDTSGRRMLRNLGVPLHTIDAGLPEDEVLAEIRKILGLDFETLPWAFDSLIKLDGVSRSLGIEAWIGSGALYRPFWNGRFGPFQHPTDIDVAVQNQQEVEPLLEALNRFHPETSWSVLCPRTYVQKKYGIDTATIKEAKRYTSFCHKGGLVRWYQGRLEIDLAPGTEEALRNGVVRFNDRLLGKLDETKRNDIVATSLDKVRKTLKDYPGLTLDEDATRYFRERFGIDHQNRTIVSTWRNLKSQVILEEKDPQKVAFCRRALGPRERKIAHEILQFHRNADFRPETPPRSRRAWLPQPLEDLRIARERLKSDLSLSEEQKRLIQIKEIIAPEGYASWLHFMTLEADDSAFREWFLNQAHHHRPFGGPDRYLQDVLSFRIFEPGKRSLHDDRQSAMHQGWPLDRHLMASVLQLGTDWVMGSFHNDLSPQNLRELRSAMRMAMLFHDTGKLINAHQPRRHSKISGRLWLKHKPDWFPEGKTALVKWMVETHDLFGAFGRGITEKRGHEVGDYDLNLELATSYFGGLDSQAVRIKLRESGLPFAMAVEINKEIWMADIGSIASLRWLLPVAEMVARLILVGAPPDRREREKGSAVLQDTLERRVRIRRKE